MIWKSVRDLIDRNRQQGTTTYLAKVAAETHGLLVVRDLEAKQKVLRNFHVQPRVITLAELASGLPGKMGALFFDTDAVNAIISHTTMDKATHLIDGYFPTNYQDGYKLVITNNTFNNTTLEIDDGYNVAVRNCDQQMNVKLTKDDMTQIQEINQDFFEKEASNSMLGRILIRKGIQFFKNLKK